MLLNCMPCLLFRSYTMHSYGSFLARTKVQSRWVGLTSNLSRLCCSSQMRCRQCSRAILGDRGRQLCFIAREVGLCSNCSRATSLVDLAFSGGAALSIGVEEQDLQVSNCSKSLHLFTGLDSLRQTLARGVKNGENQGESRMQQAWKVAVLKKPQQYHGEWRMKARRSGCIQSTHPFMPSYCKSFACNGLSIADTFH